MRQRVGGWRSGPAGLEVGGKGKEKFKAES